MSIHRVSIGIACALLLPTTAMPQGKAPSVDATRLRREVERFQEEVGNETRVGVWLGGGAGDAWFASGGGLQLPTASAIKTAFLVELHAAHPDELDMPSRVAEAALANDKHPALAPFTKPQREEIRAALKGASVRKLGAVMMGGAPASNIVYNAAANLVMADLGGPTALGEKVQNRDVSFKPIYVRRYMLTDRNARGDNTASPAALGSLLAALASNRVQGLGAEAHAAIRASMVTRLDAKGRRWHEKSGALDSDPVTRVWSGWVEGPNGPVVAVVMTSRKVDDPATRGETGKRLDEAVAKLARTLLAAGVGEPAASIWPGGGNARIRLVPSRVEAIRAGRAGLGSECGSVVLDQILGPAPLISSVAKSS